VRSFWDERYDTEEFVYGTAPIPILKNTLSKLHPGSILLPGEGEGRNGVFAASQGWDVHAFDFSVEGKNKALAFAEKQGVCLDFSISDYQSYQPNAAFFDVIGLFYTHMASEDRKLFHARMLDGLKSGGTIVLQVFSQAQLGRTSGGPKHLSMFHTIEELAEDFKSLEIEQLEEFEEELDEGPFHQGMGSLIRMIATKK